MISKERHDPPTVEDLSVVDQRGRSRAVTLVVACAILVVAGLRLLVIVRRRQTAVAVTTEAAGS